MNKAIEIAKSKGFSKTDIDDLITIKNVKGGDKAEFAKIVDKYYEAVKRKMLVYHNGDEMKAEDGASDVMVKILDNLNKWKYKDGKFKSWVYRLTYTTFVDTYRKEKRSTTGNSVSIDSLFRNDVGESQDEISTIQIKDDELIADELIESKEMIAKMMKALDELSDVEKQIIEMRYFSGMRFDVIAEKIGLDENSCKVKIYRAKKKLKKLLT